jgi:hypothetical protein
LKINRKKIITIVFKILGKLKVRERKRMNGQNVEVVDTFKI